MTNKKKEFSFFPIEKKPKLKNKDVNMSKGDNAKRAI
jgi:hypothetical protein